MELRKSKLRVCRLSLYLFIIAPDNIPTRAMNFTTKSHRDLKVNDFYDFWQSQSHRQSTKYNCIGGQYLFQCYDKTNTVRINRTECPYYAVFLNLVLYIGFSSYLAVIAVDSRPAVVIYIIRMRTGKTHAFLEFHCSRCPARDGIHVLFVFQ